MALSAAPPTPAAVDPAASSGAPAADAITPRPPAPPGVGALDRRIAGAPDDARLYLERGNRYLKAGANERAIADYTRALELDDGLEEAYFNRGMARG
ncbi:MAG: tetratricopeptide repeat protein, partial [Gammaproteobacteria bacterium]|nr:tetratricopeptide repeat protein [Gammaproteobacteria bacterium]